MIKNCLFISSYNNNFSKHPTNSIIKALECLDIQTDLYDYTKAYTKFGGSYKPFLRNLHDHTKDKSYDFIFIGSKGLIYNQDKNLQQLRDTFKDTSIVFWLWDVRYEIEWWEKHFNELLRYADIAYVCCYWPELNKYFKNDNILALPLGYNSFLFYPDNRIETKFQISFAGEVLKPNLRPGPPDRFDLIKGLVERYKNKFRFINANCKQPNSYLYGDSYTDFIQQSRINIGQIGWPNFPLYTTFREFEILGSGGFLITNKINEMNRLFPENSLVACETLEDYYNNIDYFLKKENNNKLNDIRQNAVKISQKHTMVKRMEVLLTEVSFLKDSASRSIYNLYGKSNKDRIESLFPKIDRYGY